MPAVMVNQCITLTWLRVTQIASKMLLVDVSLRVSSEEIRIFISRLSKDHPH